MNITSFTKLEQQEITEVLDNFGLNEKDRKVYFSLLNMDSGTITPLSKTVGMPPTTVQAIMFRLEKKGLLSVTTRKSRHVYSANEPEVFKKILERKMQDLNGIMPLLKKLKEEDSVKANIKIYYRERMADIFHEALNSKEKLVYEIVAARDLQEILGEKFHFSKRRIEKGVRLNSLRVEKHEIKKYNKAIHARELRAAKFLPAEFTFSSSVMFWDSTVAFFTTKREGLAFTVNSPVITEMIKQMFTMLWSVSRKMETIEEV